MAPLRVVKALDAMKDLGIPRKTVKPVLKKLLQLYDNNWGLIEEENYRVLADAIFDFEDSKEEDEEKKKSDNIEIIRTSRENEKYEDYEPPMTRKRTLQDHGHLLVSVPNPITIHNQSSPKRTRFETSPLGQPSFINENVDEDSHQLHLIRKNKNPVLPSLTSRSPGFHLIEASNNYGLKEPKNEPGTSILPKAKHLSSSQRHSNVLIKPKSEPFVEDLPPFEIPLAVLPPSYSNPSRNEDPRKKDGLSSKRNGCELTNLQKNTVSQCQDAISDQNGVKPDSPCKNKINAAIVSVPETCLTNVDIASSPSGEVKLSLVCNMALDKPDFHMPTLEAVMKMVEDKCLRSYRILEPNFSLMHLMKEFCQCVLELGNDQTTGEPEHVNIVPNIEFLKKPNIFDILGSETNQFVGNMDIQEHPPNIPDSETANYEVSSMTTSKNHVNEPKSKKRVLEKVKGKEKCLQDSGSSSLALVQQYDLPFDREPRPNHDVNDITKGEENVCISLVNEVNSEQYPELFYYIPQSVVYQNARVSFTLSRIEDEDCCMQCYGDCLSSSIPCPCARETGGEFAYTLDGVVKEELLDECISINNDPEMHRLFYCEDCPLERTKSDAVFDSCKGHFMRKFIKECWSKCGCSKQCGNRVVQRGITCNLQVFLTSEGKGWGLRTLQALPKGSFVCEYVGEILTCKELHERNTKNSGNERHNHPLLLDADWGAGKVLKDEEALCLDATSYGNVSRFINHRCFDANMIEIPVEVESPDHHYYHLAFFTTKRVEALDELTWDYGINFDDHDYLGKAFRCLCGSEFCRDVGRSKS